jgi:hypothetical protein
MEFKMKKFLIAVSLSVAAVSSFAEESFCKHKEVLKVGTYGALAGAAASLLIPGAGPVIATSILTGTVVTTGNVAVCAFDEKDRKDKLAAFKKANSEPTSFDKAVAKPVEDRSITDKAVISLTQDYVNAVVKPVEDRSIKEQAVVTISQGYTKAQESVSKAYSNLTK